MFMLEEDVLLEVILLFGEVGAVRARELGFLDHELALELLVTLEMSLPFVGFPAQVAHEPRVLVAAQREREQHIHHL